MRGKVMCCSALTACVCLLAASTAIAVDPAGVKQPSLLKGNGAVQPGATVLDASSVKAVPAGLAIRPFGGGAIAGGTGEPVYSNDTCVVTSYFAPGTGVDMGDDMALCASGGCDVVYYDLVVFGGTGGGGTFDVTVGLYTDAPCNGGTLIAGTDATATGVPDDGNLYLISNDLSATPVAAPGSVHMVANFSTDTAGWVFAGAAEIGSSGDVFSYDIPGCFFFFGGDPVANFLASVNCDNSGGTLCAGATFLVYSNTFASGFFFDLGADELHADDLEAGSGAPCDMSSYSFQVAGTGGGTFDINLALYEADPGTGDPTAPIAGTEATFTGLAADGFANILTVPVASGTFTVPASPDFFWVVWDSPQAAATTAGGLLGGCNDIGISGDVFGIFNDPSAPGDWSYWFFGGCDCTLGNPPTGICGSFRAEVSCVGEAPTGACCSDVDEFCVEGCSQPDCLGIGGRWLVDAACDPDPFTPACGTQACCMEDESCSDLSSGDCDAAGGIQQTGFCATVEPCPNFVCFTATGDCFTGHGGLGCGDLTCCDLVCDFDSFCCDVAWDATCAGNAVSLCPIPPDNDACANAIEAFDGDTAYSTVNASTDGLADCLNGDPAVGDLDIWYTYTATCTGSLLVDQCSNNYDATLQVYAGDDCDAILGGSADQLGCSDEGCNADCAATGGGGQLPSDCEGAVCVTAGQVYTIRVAGWNLASGDGTLHIECAAGDPACVTCPSATILSADPPDGTVDARQPNATGATLPRQGIGSATEPITIDIGVAGAGADCFTLCESAADNTLGANSISSVTDNGDGTYTIALTNPLSTSNAGTVGLPTFTTISYSDGSFVTYVRHPADTTGDGTSSVVDVLRIIDDLNNVVPPTHGIYSEDIDHSGLFTSADLLRAVDLLNGAGVYDTWNGVVNPANTCP